MLWVCVFLFFLLLFLFHMFFFGACDPSTFFLLYLFHIFVCVCVCVLFSLKNSWWYKPESKRVDPFGNFIWTWKKQNNNNTIIERQQSTIVSTLSSTNGYRVFACFGFYTSIFPFASLFHCFGLVRLFVIEYKNKHI